MKQLYKFDQGSVRLELEGMPDLSLGHDHNTIGILLLWKIQFIGGPLLEGKKEHLEGLMNAVLQYSRYRLSGLKRTFGLESSFVTISATDSQHLLTLRSSQKSVAPITIYLDDAELIDLTRCLDQLRNDSRITLKFDLPAEAPLGVKEFVTPKKFLKQLTTPVIGFSAIALSALFLLNFHEAPDELLFEQVNKAQSNQSNKQ